MPSLRWATVFAALGTLLVTRDAWGGGGSPIADDRQPSHASSTAFRWDASIRGGYGSVFTDGISYLGAGLGGTVGYHATTRIRLEVSALYGLGSSAEARNALLMYRSSYTSGQATAGVGYDLELGPFIIRPAVRGGGRFVQGRVVVGGARSFDAHVYPIVGPCVTTLVRVGRVELGLDAETFFLPTWPAAPSAGLYGLAGVTF